MATAAKKKRQSKRGRGRPTKFTADVKKKVLHVVGLGGSLEMAAKYAGISPTTLGDWIRRGDGMMELKATAEYSRFSRQIRQAQGEGDATLLQAVRSQVVGLPCNACTDGTIKGDEGPERCPACKGSSFAARPDGRLSLDVLSRRHPQHFGRKDRMQIDQTVQGVITVDVSVKALGMDMAGMDAEQLKALAWGPDVIDAVEE